MSVFETVPLKSAGSSTRIVNYFEDFKKAKTKLCAKKCYFWMDTIYVGDIYAFIF